MGRGAYDTTGTPKSKHGFRGVSHDKHQSIAHLIRPLPRSDNLTILNDHFVVQENPFVGVCTRCWISLFKDRSDLEAHCKRSCSETQQLDRDGKWKILRDAFCVQHDVEPRFPSRNLALDHSSHVQSAPKLRASQSNCSRHEAFSEPHALADETPCETRDLVIRVKDDVAWDGLQNESLQDDHSLDKAMRDIKLQPYAMKDESLQDDHAPDKAMGDIELQPHNTEDLTLTKSLCSTMDDSKRPIFPWQPPSSRFEKIGRISSRVQDLYKEQSHGKGTDDSEVLPSITNGVPWVRSLRARSEHVPESFSWRENVEQDDGNGVPHSLEALSSTRERASSEPPSFRLSLRDVYSRGRSVEQEAGKGEQDAPETSGSTSTSTSDRHNTDSISRPAKRSSSQYRTKEAGKRRKTCAPDDSDDEDQPRDFGKLSTADTEFEGGLPCIYHFRQPNIYNSSNPRYETCHTKHLTTSSLKQHLKRIHYDRLAILYSHFIVEDRDQMHFVGVCTRCWVLSPFRTLRDLEVHHLRGCTSNRYLHRDRKFGILCDAFCPQQDADSLQETVPEPNSPASSAVPREIVTQPPQGLERDNHHPVLDDLDTLRKRISTLEGQINALQDQNFRLRTLETGLFDMTFWHVECDCQLCELLRQYNAACHSRSDLTPHVAPSNPTSTLEGPAIDNPGSFDHGIRVGDVEEDPVSTFPSGLDRASSHLDIPRVEERGKIPSSSSSEKDSAYGSGGRRAS